MHKLQTRLLELAEKDNLGKFTLREIGEKIGETHPQKIKHHLNQLFIKGFLKENKKEGIISKINSDQKGNILYSIPILGYANCGQALAFADEGYEGYLQVSKSLVPNFTEGKVFAVKAIGDSMNKSDINGKSLSDGDYAIVYSSSSDVDSYNNRYVLSVIDGMANIKKLKVDRSNKQILLLSESTSEYSPIIVSDSDFNSYLINGEIKAVVKNNQ